MKSSYGTIIRQGLLKKQSSDDTYWSRRYAVLTEDGHLRLYRNRGELKASGKKRKALGKIKYQHMDKVFLIPETLRTHHDEEHFKFAIVSNVLCRQWHFSACSQDDAKLWVKCLNTAANSVRRKHSRQSLVNLSQSSVGMSMFSPVTISIEDAPADLERDSAPLELDDYSSECSLSGKPFDAFEERPGMHESTSSRSFGRAEIAKAAGERLIEDLRQNDEELETYSLHSDDDKADDDNGIDLGLERLSSMCVRTKLHVLDQPMLDLSEIFASMDVVRRVHSDWVKNAMQGSLELKTDTQVLGKHQWHSRYCRLCTHALVVYKESTTVSKVKSALAEKKKELDSAPSPKKRVKMASSGKKGKHRESVIEPVLSPEIVDESNVELLIRLDSVVCVRLRTDKSPQRRFDILYYDCGSLLEIAELPSTEAVKGQLKLVSIRAENEILCQHWCKKLTASQRKHRQSVRECLEMIGLFEYHLLRHSTALAVKREAEDLKKHGKAECIASMELDLRSRSQKQLHPVAATGNHEYERVAGDSGDKGEEVILQVHDDFVKEEEKRAELEQTPGSEGTIGVPDYLKRGKQRMVPNMDSRESTVWKVESRLMSSWRLTGIQQTDAAATGFESREVTPMPVGADTPLIAASLRIPTPSPDVVPHSHVSAHSAEVMSKKMASAASSPSGDMSPPVARAAIGLDSATIVAAAVLTPRIIGSVARRSMRKSSVASDGIGGVGVVGGGRLHYGSLPSTTDTKWMDKDNSPEFGYGCMRDSMLQSSALRLLDDKSPILVGTITIEGGMAVAFGSNARGFSAATDSIGDREKEDGYFFSVSQDVLSVKRRQSDKIPLLSVAIEAIQSVSLEAKGAHNLGVGFDTSIFGAAAMASAAKGKGVTALGSLMDDCSFNDDWRLTFDAARRCRKWHAALSKASIEAKMVKETIRNELLHIRKDFEGDNFPIGHKLVESALRIVANTCVYMPHLLEGTATQRKAAEAIRLEDATEAPHSSACCECCSACIVL